MDGSFPWEQQCERTKKQDYNSHNEWYKAMDVYFSAYYLQQDLVNLLAIYCEVNNSKQQTDLTHDNQEITSLSTPSSLDLLSPAASAQSLFQVVEEPPAKELADNNTLNSYEEDNEKELMLARVKFRDCQQRNEEETFFSNFRSEDCSGCLMEDSSLRSQFPQLFGNVPSLPLMGDVTSAPHGEFPTAQLTVIFNKVTTPDNDNNTICENEESLSSVQVPHQEQEMKVHSKGDFLNDTGRKEDTGKTTGMDSDATNWSPHLWLVTLQHQATVIIDSSLEVFLRDTYLSVAFPGTNDNFDTLSDPLLEEAQQSFTTNSR